MYHFNQRLLESLPAVLGTTQKRMLEMIGKPPSTYFRWKANGIPCAALAEVCNSLRISLSSFLLLKGDQELQRQLSDYVLPEDIWKPVSFDSRAIGRMFGPDGVTGVSKTEAARRLGLGHYNIFDNWDGSRQVPLVGDLLNLLNEFHLDAALFFSDPNLPVPLPDWTVSERHVADILNERMAGYREMEKTIGERNRTIQALRRDKERLQREVLVLKEEKASARAAVPGPAGERGYVFHWALWEALPRMTDLTLKEYCERIGLGYKLFYVKGNISVSVLLAVCNMFRISVSHFFLPKGEKPAVHDLGYYTVSPSLFTEVESRMENLRYLFGKYSAYGFTRTDLEAAGVGYKGLMSMSSDGWSARVETLCGICTTFNIPPYIFFHDKNRRKAPHAESANETLLLNAISMSREIESLRKTVKGLKEKLKEE